MPSRVLVFGMTDKRGGVESFLMNATSSIDSSRVVFDYIVNTDTVAYEDELQKRGSAVIHVPMRAEHPLSFYRYIDSFFKKNANRYDAIWVNVCSLANIDYLKYAKKYGIKTRVIHCHNSRNMDSRVRGLLHIFNKYRIRDYATDFWTCSDEATDWFYGAAIRHDANYRVINNSVDVRKFEFNPLVRSAVREEWGVTDNDIVVGNVGRLHPQKNQSFLIDAFSLVQKDLPGATLFIAGQGELKNQLQTRIEQTGLVGKIHLLGEIKDTASFYQGLDVFAFPSLYEGLSIALLEAQANGVPAVISTGNPENAVINPNVIRIPTERLEGWAEAIKNSIGNRLANSENRFAHSAFNSLSQSDFLEGFFLKAGRQK